MDQQEIWQPELFKFSRFICSPLWEQATARYNSPWLKIKSRHALQISGFWGAE